MKITKYVMEVDDGGVSRLVKEESRLYQGASQITNTEDMVRMLNEMYRLDRMAEEHLYEVALNVKGKVLGVFEVSHGTVDSTFANPCDVFKRALLLGSTSIIIAHNHPSGEVTPSGEDIKTFKRMKEAGELLGIKMLDSIIIGKSGNT